MITIRTKLYQFNELSKKAQAAAVENNAINAEYFFADDAINSLKEFAKHFNCELQDYEFDFTGAYCHSWAKFDTDSAEFTEDELLALIESMGGYNKETLRGDGDCVFSGYCADEDAADGARIAFFNGERDINNILQSGFNSWLKSVMADYEYQLSHEGFADHCEANNLEFKEDGTIF